MGALSVLTIDLRGNSAHFQKELKRSGSKAKAFAKQVRANSQAVVKSLGAIGAVGAVALAAIYKQSSANIDALAKQADKLGVTTQALAGLQHAADLTGVSSKALNKGLLDMTVKIQDASKGMGEGKEAIKTLGLDAVKLAKLSPDKAFVKISEAMKGVATHGEKVAIAYDLFGAKGTDLLNTLNLGEAALNKTAKEAEILGLALNRVDAAKVEAANDAMTRSAGVVSGLGNTITVTLAPYVKGISEEFYNSALEAGGFGEFTTKAMNAVVKAVAYTANVIRGLKVVWLVVKLATAEVISGMLRSIAFLDNGITSLLNKLPGVEVKANLFIQGFSDAMKTQVGTIQTELEELANKPLPYDGIVAWAEEAKRKSLEAANAVAVNAAQNGGYSLAQAEVTNPESSDDKNNKNLDDKNKNAEQKVKTHEEKILAIKAKNSKKLAAVQDAIRIKNLVKEKAAQLKIALGDGYVAVQKAWASAPFPLNAVPVAMAVGATALNVAAIGGLESGGYVGNRSIVEVGERNKPEVLEFGGRNFLLGGNGGAVFNQSQLTPATPSGSSSPLSINYSPVINAIDATGVADLLADHQETIYNLIANAKADRGEDF